MVEPSIYNAFLEKKMKEREGIECPHRLLTLMNLCGLTQREAAAELNIDYQSLNRYLNRYPDRLPEDVEVKLEILITQKMVAGIKN